MSNKQNDIFNEAREEAKARAGIKEKVSAKETRYVLVNKAILVDILQELCIPPMVHSITSDEWLKVMLKKIENL